MMGLSRTVQRMVCLERKAAAELRAQLDEERAQCAAHKKTIMQLQAQIAVRCFLLVRDLRHCSVFLLLFMQLHTVVARVFCMGDAPAGKKNADCTCRATLGRQVE